MKKNMTIKIINSPYHYDDYEFSKNDANIANWFVAYIDGRGCTNYEDTSFRLKVKTK